MKTLYDIGIKMILYIVFFASAIQIKPVVDWFANMNNMTIAMILMAVVMLVDFFWGLFHAK